MDSAVRCRVCDAELSPRPHGRSGRPTIYCSDACRAKWRKVYARRYFEANASKWKTSTAPYATNPERERAYRAKWREANRDKIRAASRIPEAKRRRIRLTPDERIERERARKRELQRRLRADNPERSRQNGRRYYARHAERLRTHQRRKRNTPAGREAAIAACHLRRARLAGVERERIDRRHVYARDNYTCARCGQFVEPKDRSLDHRVPISMGGSHTYANVQLMHRICNIRKRARMPEEDRAVCMAEAS